MAEKYISKTSYKTFSHEEFVQEMNVNFEDLQSKDFFVE